MLGTRKAALVATMVVAAMLTVPAVAAADGDGLEPGVRRRGGGRKRLGR